METTASLSFSTLKGSRPMPTRMTRASLQTGRAGTPWNTQPAGGAAQHLRAHQAPAARAMSAESSVSRNLHMNTQPPVSKPQAQHFKQRRSFAV